MTERSQTMQRLVVLGILLVASVFVGGLLYVYSYHNGELERAATASRSDPKLTTNSQVLPPVTQSADSGRRILLFTTNWSSSGLKMKEILQEFAVLHPDVECLEYDAATDQQLVVEYGIQGFPSVVVQSGDEIILLEAITIGDLSAYLARLD